jgi:glycosyltransferase involved in cell wall biosynthesis
MRCVESVLQSDYENLEITVVDDSSDTPAAEFINEEHPQVTVIRNEKRMMVAYSRNRGAAASSGDLLLFLDDDNVVSPKAVGELVTAFGRPEVAVASPVIFFMNNPKKVWSSSINRGRLPGFYVLGNRVPSKSVPTLSFHDAFMMTKASFERCHGFDSATFPTHFSELDFAYRMREAGYESVVSPRAHVWHDVPRAHMHVDSVRSYYTLRNRVILARRYYSRAERMQYELLLLPILTWYYLLHHAAAADDSKVRASANLVRGVVAAIAAPRLNVAWRDVERPTQPRREPSEPLRQEAARPLVSIVIPTKDSATTLGRTLDSVEAQTYPNIEIVVVDNFSRDGTLEVARGKKGVRCFSAGPQRSAQVNLGAEMAKGKYIYRIDSDFLLDPSTVQEAVDRCEQDGYKVVAIHNTSDPTVSFWSAVRKLERDCYVDDSVNIAARFFEADVFRSSGGFDERLIASEDYALHNKVVSLGYKVGRIKAKETHIGEPKTLREVVVKNIFYGRSIMNFVKLSPGVSARQLSPFRVAYARHWRDFARQPKLALGFLLYQYVRYASAIAGVLASES